MVLGGGGVTGIAWEIGVLLGLADAGIDLTDADLIVGTSAGSVVAAQITSPMPLTELFDRQIRGYDAGDRREDRIAPDVYHRVRDVAARPVAGESSGSQIGRMALSSETVNEDDRFAVDLVPPAVARLARSRPAHHRLRRRIRRVSGVHSRRRRAAGEGRRGELRSARRLALRDDRRPPLHGRRYALGRRTPISPPASNGSSCIAPISTGIGSADCRCRRRSRSCAPVARTWSSSSPTRRRRSRSARTHSIRRAGDCPRRPGGPRERPSPTRSAPRGRRPRSACLLDSVRRAVGQRMKQAPARLAVQPALGSARLLCVP